jgi:hypothetical protein
MLANVYRRQEDVTQFWVSEKLDGVRARWDGKQLISRGSNVFVASEWFVRDFPGRPLDGELWMGRGRYEDVVSVVRQQTPHDGWKHIKFMVFDLPAHGGPFSERVASMRQLAVTPKPDMNPCRDDELERNLALTMPESVIILPFSISTHTLTAISASCSEAITP